MLPGCFLQGALAGQPPPAGPSRQGHGVKVLRSAVTSATVPHVSCSDLWGDLTEEEALELAIHLSREEENRQEEGQCFSQVIPLPPSSGPCCGQCNAGLSLLLIPPTRHYHLVLLRETEKLKFSHLARSAFRTFYTLLTLDICIDR